MTPTELTKIGESLYGKRWKAPLAKRLGLSRERISRLANGHADIPASIAVAVRLLAETQQTPLQVRRFRKRQETFYKEYNGLRCWLIHGDAREEVQRLPVSINALVTDPVWPKALPSLRGSEDPFGLLAQTLRLATGHHQIEQIILQFRCDSDPRILSAVPGHYPFVRLAWLPVSVATPTGRILMSGDVGYLFGVPPVSRAGNRSLPGEMQKLYTPLCDYPDNGASPKAQPFKGLTKHPCPRSLEHVEWLVEKFTEPGAIVLDPFTGSGTTALACLRQGRHFVGIEIERDYFEEARERLQAFGG